MQRVKGLGTSSPKWAVSIKTLLLGPMELCGRGRKKSLRAIGGGAYQAQQDQVTHELTETIAAYTGPRQASKPDESQC